MTSTTRTLAGLCAILLVLLKTSSSFAAYQADQDINAQTNFLLFKVPKIVLTTGLGLTYGAYSQQTGDIEQSQLGLTGKITLATGFFKRKVPLEVSAFGTLLPILSNPSSLSSNRTLGLNIRTGFRTKIGPVYVGLLVGEYFWRMIVPGDQYGISYVYGPQAFFTVSKGTKWGLYAKLASLNPQFSFDFSNREIAVGGVLESPFNTGLPMSFTLDVSEMKTPTLDSELRMRFLTVSLGMLLRF